MILSSMKIRYEPLRSLAYTSLSSDYVAVGTPFVNPVRQILITNLTDANLIISYNGVTAMDVVAANTGKVLDYSSNKADQAGVLEQDAGDRCYVMLEEAAATTGNVYVTIIYASNV